MSILGRDDDDDDVGGGGGLGRTGLDRASSLLV
jgi:hypothetical protein